MLQPVATVPQTLAGEVPCDGGRLLVVVVLFVLAGAVGWAPAINAARLIFANQDSR